MPYHSEIVPESIHEENSADYFQPNKPIEQEHSNHSSEAAMA